MPLDHGLVTPPLMPGVRRTVIMIHPTVHLMCAPVTLTLRVSSPMVTVPSVWPQECGQVTRGWMSGVISTVKLVSVLHHIVSVHESQDKHTKGDYKIKVQTQKYFKV